MMIHDSWERMYEQEMRRAHYFETKIKYVRKELERRAESKRTAAVAAWSKEASTACAVGHGMRDAYEEAANLLGEILDVALSTEDDAA